MNALGQADQGPTRAARRIDHKGPLFGGRLLASLMIEWDDGGDWCPQVPLHFGPRMVVARVVPVENQVYAPPVDAQLTLELVERCARVPQPPTRSDALTRST